MSNEIIFKNNNLAALQRYADLEKTAKEIENEKKKLRNELLDAMRKNNLVGCEINIANEVLKITRVAPSSSKSINMKLLRISDPDTYDELLDRYPKTSDRAEHIRVKVEVAE